MSLAQRVAALDERPFVIFIGATTDQRALACHAVTGQALHLEPVANIDELSATDLIRADVLLVWDEDETILELARCLSPLGCWTPIVAIGELPTARQVVGAIAAGAIDYVEWPCAKDSLILSLLAAYERNEQSLPLRERQAAARQALQSLSQRERQVLAALSKGLANKEIGRELGISPRTVEVHRANLMMKIQAKNSADAIRLALEASMPASPFPRIANSARPSPARSYPLAPLPMSVARPAFG